MAVATTQPRHRNKWGNLGLAGIGLVFVSACLIAFVRPATAAEAGESPPANAGASVDRLYTTVPAVGPAPLTLDFAANTSGTDPSATYSYKFDFGDGSDPFVNSEPKAFHTYVTDGSYTAGIEMSDESGVVGSASIQVAVGTPMGNKSISLSLYGGGYDYSRDDMALADDTTLKADRDVFGIASISGTADMPGAAGSGTATAKFNITRFLVLPIYVGTVIVSDPDDDLYQNTPFLFGSVKATPYGASGQAYWFKSVPFSPWPRSYRLSFEIHDPSATKISYTVDMPRICFSIVCIVGDDPQGGPTFTFTYDPYGQPKLTGTFVGEVDVKGFKVPVSGTIDDQGATISGEVDLGPIVIGSATRGQVALTGRVYWGNHLEGITVTDPEGVPQQVRPGDFVLDASVQLEFDVGTGFDLVGGLEVAHVGEPGWVTTSGSITTGESAVLTVNGFFEKDGSDVDYSLEAAGDIAIGDVTITGAKATIDPSGMAVSVAELDVASIDLTATDLAGTLKYEDGSLVSTISAGNISMGLNGYIIVSATITINTSGIQVTDGSFTYGSDDVNVTLDFSGSLTFSAGSISFSLTASNASATIYDFPVSVGSATLAATVGASETVISISAADLDIDGVTGSLDGEFDFQTGAGKLVNLTGSLKVIVKGIEVDIPSFDLDAATLDIDVYIPVVPDPQISDPDCSKQYICITGTMSYTGGGVNTLNIHLSSTMPDFEWGPFDFKGSTVVLDTDVSSKGIDITEIAIAMGEGDLRINGTFSGSIYKADGKNTLQVEIAAAKSPPLSVDYFGVPGLAIEGTTTDLALSGDVSFPDGIAEIDFTQASLRLGPLTAQFSGNVTFGDPITYSLSADMNPLPGGIPGSATFTLDNDGYKFDAHFAAGFFTGDLEFTGTFSDDTSSSVSATSTSSSAPVHGMPVGYGFTLESPIVVTITDTDVTATASATFDVPYSSLSFDLSADVDISASGITADLDGSADPNCGDWFNHDGLIILGCMTNLDVALSLDWDASSEELSVNGTLQIWAFAATIEIVVPIAAAFVSVGLDFTVASDGSVPWYDPACFTATTIAPIPGLPIPICIPASVVWGLIHAAF